MQVAVTVVHRPDIATVCGGLVNMLLCVRMLPSVAAQLASCRLLKLLLPLCCCAVLRCAAL